MHGVAKRVAADLSPVGRGSTARCGVFEITSRVSRLEDLGIKRAVYAMLGVQEYFLYDPLGEYLRPLLQGYLLQEEEYQLFLPVALKATLSARPWAWSCG